MKNAKSLCDGHRFPAAVISHGTENHLASLSFAARGAGVESRWHKPFDLTEAEMKLRADDHPLKTVPGIGKTLATVIMPETGTVARLPGSVSSVRTVAASIACDKETAEKRVKSIPATAARIWHGRSSRPQTLRYDNARRHGASMSASRVQPTVSSRSRP